MIARPVHSVNVGSPLTPATDLPVSADVDFALSAANVTRWGGDRARYAASLAAALGPGIDPGDLRRVAAVAAWRSGVIGIRATALSVLPVLPVPAVSGALGLHPDQVSRFIERQTVDPFFWPAWPTNYSFLIARVGGFIGLGGPWTTPPRTVAARGADRWVIDTDDSSWHLVADLFGHSITPADPSHPQPAGRDRPTAQAHVRPTSYLVDIVRVPA